MTRILLTVAAGVSLSAAARAQCERAEALAAYESEWLATNTTTAELAWTGAVVGCDPGEPSELARDHALRRVNYYRAACGLPPVTLDAEWSRKAQAAAVMMDSANANDHYPEPDYPCFTEDGRQAAGKSNLYTGRWGAHAVAGYIEDPGAHNGAVGHRRWILFPPQQQIGMGFTSGADAMWVVGGPKSRPATPEGVAWPPSGYVPAALVHPRWSFAQHRADFSAATVTLTGPRGEDIPLTVNEIENGFGDNTIVWEPDMSLVDTDPEYDEAYRVRIDNVVEGGVPRSYAYTVIAMAVGKPGCTAQLVSSTGAAAPTPPAIAYHPGGRELVVRGEVGEHDVLVSDEVGRVLLRGRVAAGAPLSVRHLPRGVYVAQLLRPQSAGGPAQAHRFAIL